jgi:hypothetical protein
VKCSLEQVAAKIDQIDQIDQIEFVANDDEDDDTNVAYVIV